MPTSAGLRPPSDSDNPSSASNPNSTSRATSVEILPRLESETSFNLALETARASACTCVMIPACILFSITG